MTNALLMDRMFQRIMRGLVDTGRAPHYAELARELGLGVERAMVLLGMSSLWWAVIPGLVVLIYKFARPCGMSWPFRPLWWLWAWPTS